MTNVAESADGVRVLILSDYVLCWGILVVVLAHCDLSGIGIGGLIVLY